ncbi:MAG TPA: GNAT family N-acetyltransferase [Chitinophagaceae bacterium]
MSDIILRKIKKEDNAALANIIRQTLAEFGANKKGTVYFDPTTDELYDLFKLEKSVYFVAEKEGEIIGGGGIYPTQGLPADTCELVKMYLLPMARGKGLGKEIIEKNLRFAKEAGFKKVYLESMPELKKALKVYEKAGFKYLEGPLGKSGHFGCDLWMIKEL